MAMAQPPDAGKKVEFEVASIRPAQQDNRQDSDIDQGRFKAHNLTLKRLIANAYDIDMSLVLGGPNWVDSDSYDINAKIPEDVQQRRQTVPLMTQNLLAERFRLAIHREQREISGYALAVAPKGVKMKPSGAGGQSSEMHTNNTHLTARNVTMEAFAKYLSRVHDAGRLVVDKTGLSGGFDFELNWMPEQRETKPEGALDDRPSLFTALQEQLGLKLESAKVPVSAIVIERAEKPAAD
jgi:uncharacterized protein (TIGR03435 family)